MKSERARKVRTTTVRIKMAETTLACHLQTHVSYPAELTDKVSSWSKILDMLLLLLLCLLCALRLCCMGGGQQLPGFAAASHINGVLGHGWRRPTFCD